MKALLLNTFKHRDTGRDRERGRETYRFLQTKKLERMGRVTVKEGEREREATRDEIITKTEIAK